MANVLSAKIGARADFVKEILDLRSLFTDISRLSGRLSLTLCLTIAQLLRSGPVNSSDERRCICRESQLLIRIKINLLL
jgi:hypothetical protein